MRRALALPLPLPLLLALALAAPPVAARDSLGIFERWGAFRDLGVPRCYAIAKAEGSPGRADEFQSYVTVGVWPRRNVRGEVHVRLAQRLAPGGPVSLSVGGQKFELVAGQADAWAQDARMDAALIAALRGGGEMTVSARAANGRTFRDTFVLRGAASAIDAAALGCSGV